MAIVGGYHHVHIISPDPEAAAQSGRFPAGSYVVVVRVLTPQGLELDRGEVRIQLVNPTRIEPVSPSRPFGETRVLPSTSRSPRSWTSHTQQRLVTQILTQAAYSSVP